MDTRPALLPRNVCIAFSHPIDSRLSVQPRPVLLSTASLKSGFYQRCNLCAYLLGPSKPAYSSTLNISLTGLCAPAVRAAGLCSTAFACRDGVTPRAVLRDVRLDSYLLERATDEEIIIRAHAKELLESFERAFEILEGIADKLLYDEGQPVTAIESREIEDIYNDAISELAPFETLIRKARGEA